MRPDVCSACGRPASTLYVSQGYIGTYYECPACFGVAEPAPAGPELITDTFAAEPTSAVYPGSATGARLLAIVDKLTGAHG